MIPWQSLLVTRMKLWVKSLRFNLLYFHIFSFLILFKNGRYAETLSFCTWAYFRLQFLMIYNSFLFLKSYFEGVVNWISMHWSIHPFRIYNDIWLIIYVCLNLRTSTCVIIREDDNDFLVQLCKLSGKLLKVNFVVIILVHIAVLYHRFTIWKNWWKCSGFSN